MTAAFIALITGTLVYLLRSFPPVFKLADLVYAPIESIPVDGGWIGVALMLLEGFLLSYVLAENEVDTTERLLLSVGFGFGLTFAIMILIGVLWELTLFSVGLIQTILLICLFFAATRRGLKLNLKSVLNATKEYRLSRPSVPLAVMLIAIGLFSVFATYRIVSLPATEWDSLAYGVNYSKIMFEQGGIPLIAGPSIGIEMSASYPPGVQLAATMMYIFSGNVNDFYYRILPPIFGIATMITTYKFATVLSKNKTIAIFAVLSLSAVPFFWEAFVQETYFLGLTMLLTLSALFLFKAYESDHTLSRRYETIGALMGGFAALTSYIGLVALGLLALYAINKRLGAKRFIWLVALFLIVVSPWYLRNLLLLWNPVYPFLGMGKYLDNPLLRSSTTQSFQNYTILPLYAWSRAACVIGATLLVMVLAYLTFSKQKNLLMILPSKFKRPLLQGIPSYLQNHFFMILLSFFLLAGTTIMVGHLPFPRYLLIALPLSAIVFSVAIKSLLAMNTVAKAIAITLLSMVVIMSALVLPYMNSAKPPARTGDDRWSYLIHVYEDEADVWKWINDKTDSNAAIATFDIKQYYLERDTLPLDGYESAPFYNTSIEECMNSLEDRGITHILSVPWASPYDLRMPPAYKNCTLTRYLGDTLYFPAIHVGSNGTTVYHVGPMDENTIVESFNLQGFIPPLKHVRINLTISNNAASFRMPIPVDYREGKMSVSATSPKSVNVTRWWNGTVPAEWMPLKQVGNNSFEWDRIDKAGYFTFEVDADQTPTESFDVALDIRFYNYWELKRL